jgi:CoA binding domain
MPVQRTSIEPIDDFLAQKRIAIVGISREEKSMSVILFKELCDRGYDVVPVNPNVTGVIHIWKAEPRSPPGCSSPLSVFCSSVAASHRLAVRSLELYWARLVDAFRVNQVLAAVCLV